MSNPTITADEALDYVRRHQIEVAGSYGKGHRKTLKYLVGAEMWVVEDHLEDVFEVTDVEPAVKFFNDLPAWHPCGAWVGIGILTGANRRCAVEVPAGQTRCTEHQGD